MAISQDLLVKHSSEYGVIVESFQKTASYMSKTHITAFLCHSHKDEKLVKGLLTWFRKEGIDIYIDWLDYSMPETPNFETAKKIQKAIEERSFFIFLATANSKASRWCPWEIGYADSSNKKISIVTTTDGNSTYGNEYLQLYDKIDIGYSTTGGKQIPKGLALFDRITKKGTWLSKTMLIKG